MMYCMNHLAIDGRIFFLAYSVMSNNVELRRSYFIPSENIFAIIYPIRSTIISTVFVFLGCYIIK